MFGPPSRARPPATVNQGERGGVALDQAARNFIHFTQISNSNLTGGINLPILFITRPLR
jgi:hypothetical protein